MDNFNEILNDTTYSILEKESEVINTYLNSLPSDNSIIVLSQKFVLVGALIIIAVLVTLCIAAVFILIVDFLQLAYLKHIAFRQKHRLELIPTYHNVRALRKADPIVRIESELSLPPPSPIPPQKEKRTITTFFFNSNKNE